MSEILYLIDGHSQIFRAYYAPFRDLTSPAGEPTRATYVFCSMLLKFIAERQPKYLAMAVDGPAEKLQRRQVSADYKAQREAPPEDLHPQVERIIEIVRALQIPVLEMEGQEADDILATFVERYASEEMNVVLISRDKDLEQLLGPHVRMYDPMKDETITTESVQEKKGYTPDQAIDVQTLSGDSVDNIPGVPGVGVKTAAKLIDKYGSVDQVLAHADELSPKLSENVKKHADELETSRELVTLRRDLPLEVDLDDVRFTPGAGDEVRRIFAELGFNRLFDQLDSVGLAGSDPGDTPSAAAGATTARDFTYACVDTPEALESLVAELRQAERIAVDTETTGTRPMWCELVGICLSAKPCTGSYIPVRGPLGARTLELELVREKLGAVLGDESIEKVGHHLKYDMLVLRNAGIELAGPMFDTMIAAHVLDASRNSYKLDALVADVLNHRCIPIEELIGRGKKQITMDAVPMDVVTPYAAEDADVTLRLAEALDGQLRTEGLMELFRDLEMPLMPVLAEMERTGIPLDRDVLKQMEVALSRQADELRDLIVSWSKAPFNPDSPKQLAEVLFDQLGMPVLKRTKTGPSTDSSVLEDLAASHELPSLVLDYRKLTKLIGTYLKSLAECIHPRTGRVHTSFHQAGTATGRLSSSDPNLQNIPIRTDQGRKIRSAFVADEDWQLLSADYSQVELRMLAHLCGDERLREAFNAGLDIHRAVAAEVFSVPLEEVTADQRAKAKTVNFGIVYGQTAFGLARTLRIGRTEAGEFIQAYKARFPQIDEFLQSCVAEAKEQGYVETIFGRRRRIPDIDSRNGQKRALAERLAINSVVQGSAADLIKRAMVNLAARIRQEGRPARMLLQIHDELVFEVPDEALDAERDMIVEEMTTAIELAVPLKVDVGVGKNWMEAK